MQLAIDTLATAAKATGTLGATAEQLNDLQERAIEDFRTSVRAKPLTALGIVIAAGFPLSLLTQNSS